MNQLRVKVGKDEEAKRGRDGRRRIARKKYQLCLQCTV
jgi:hypothetical protein